MAHGRGRVRLLENKVMDFLFRRKAINDLAVLLKRIYTAVPYTHGRPYSFFHFVFFD